MDHIATSGQNALANPVASSKRLAANVERAQEGTFDVMVAAPMGCGAVAAGHRSIWHFMTGHDLASAIGIEVENAFVLCN